MNKLNEKFGLKKVFGQLGIEERSFNLLIMIERMENKILNHSWTKLFKTVKVKMIHTAARAKSLPNVAVYELYHSA